TETLEVHEPLWVIAGFAGAAVLGSGAGLVFCALAQMSRFVDRARGPLMRPLFWISGIFFVADQLPARARDALLANPVLHCTELVRAGWFPSYSAQYVDVGYVALWALSLWCVALTLERSVRGRIELT
ncbi:MAG: ABC transporter, partial [Deltaproteobacteria bacterium]